MVKAYLHVLFLYFIPLISMGFARGQEKADPNDPELNFEYLRNATAEGIIVDVRLEHQY